MPPLIAGSDLIGMPRLSERGARFVSPLNLIEPAFRAPVGTPAQSRGVLVRYPPFTAVGYCRSSRRESP